MRLFAALRPDRPALDHLDAALAGAGLGTAAHGGPPEVRPVPADQRHVTLAFYGDVPDGAADDLAAALGDALAAPGAPWLGGGAAALAGAGVFSGRTLWVGVRDEPAGLVRALAVAGAEAAATAGLRLPDEDRPRFRAHLTVARRSARGANRRRERERRRGPRRGGPWDLGDAGAPGDRPESPIDPLAGPAHALAVYLGPSWPVREVELVASRLGEGAGGGPLHEVLARVAL